MNPFTRFLSQWSGDSRLLAFITHWDALERLVINVYRHKVLPDEAAAEFERVWPWLRRHYGEWEAALRPLWQNTTAAGAPTQTDPFRLLLDLPEPASIQDNWRAMQHLPAAREALNQLLRSK